MKLKSVTIELEPSYSSVNPNKWVGRVAYQSPREETVMLLSDEAAIELLAFVGPLLAKRAAEAANLAAFTVQEAVKDAQAKLLPASSVTLNTEADTVTLS